MDDKKKKPYHRTRALVDEHRSKVFHWRTMNIPYKVIAKKLGITDSTAYNDYRAASKKFEEYWKVDAATKRNRFLQMILTVAREAWDNYVGLKSELAGNAPEYAKVRIDRNLSLVLRALRHARDLLGVDVPIPKQVVFSGDMTDMRNRFVDMIGGIQESIEGPPIDLGLVEAKDIEEDEDGGNGRVK